MKTISRAHITPVIMAKKKKNTGNSCSWGHKERVTLIYWWLKFKLVQSQWKSVWLFLRRLGINLPQESAIFIMLIYSKDYIYPITEIILIYGHHCSSHNNQQLRKYPKSLLVDEENVAYLYNKILLSCYLKNVKFTGQQKTSPSVKWKRPKGINMVGMFIHGY